MILLTNSMVLRVRKVVSLVCVDILGRFKYVDLICLYQIFHDKNVILALFFAKGFNKL
jgi:hypothetical protein